MIVADSNIIVPLFVAHSESERCRAFRTMLVTEDRRLSLACPGETLSLAEADFSTSLP